MRRVSNSPVTFMTEGRHPRNGARAKRRFSYHSFEPPTRLKLSRRGVTLSNEYPDMGAPLLTPDSTRVLVACMPKSGSTFLATALSCLPGFRRVNITPMPMRRREQEIDLLRLLQEEELTQRLRESNRSTGIRGLFKRLTSNVSSPESIARARGWVAQHHVRYSLTTKYIIEDYQIVPVVLVRNIFDALVSLRDHLMNDAVDMSMAYFSTQMRSWSDEEMADYLIDMVVPWYINFYVSWQDFPQRLQLTYEQVRSDTAGCLEEIVSVARLNMSIQDIELAIEEAMNKPIRLNKGVSGRGASFTDEHRQRAARYAAYYPHVDFSPIGL